MSPEDVVDERDGDPLGPAGFGRPLPGQLGRLRPWIEWFGPGRLIAGLATVVVVVGGGWWLLRSPAPPTEAGLPFASAPATTAGAPTNGTADARSTPPTVAPGPIVVHVAGAVVRPGVYELTGGARVHTAIDAAGGPSPGADPGALNLAAAVADGARVYVPVTGETVPVPPATSTGVTGADAIASPIDLNRATAGDLDGLPGIGPATAAAIVDHRTQHGPFASVEDLEAVRGIGPAKLEAIRDLVRV